MELKVVELFAGVGGFRVGLNNIKKFNKRTGKAIEPGEWEFVWANQWEPSTKSQPAFDCYIKRFGLKNHCNEDISKVNKFEIPNHSLLVGGFPCQDYSVARSLSSEMGIEGKKGVLWWEIVDVIFEKKPAFILLENVDRLLKSPASQRGRDFAVMLKTFENLGYMVQWREINAGEYGMPQRRKRIFIFASRHNTKYSKNIMRRKNKQRYLVNDGFFNTIFKIQSDNIEVKDKDLSVFDDEVDVSNNYKAGKFLKMGMMIKGKIINFDSKEVTDDKLYTLGDVLKQARKHHDKADYERYVIENDLIKKWAYQKGAKRIPRKRPDGSDYFYSEGSMSFPDRLDRPSRTMLTTEGTLNRSSHIIYDEFIGKTRKITEIEAELLQMFPPNWTNTGMTGRQRYFMMGNALVTGVVAMLESKLREIILSE